MSGSGGRRSRGHAGGRAAKNVKEEPEPARDRFSINGVDYRSVPPPSFYAQPVAAGSSRHRNRVKLPPAPSIEPPPLHHYQQHDNVLPSFTSADAPSNATSHRLNSLRQPIPPSYTATSISVSNSLTQSAPPLSVAKKSKKPKKSKKSLISFEPPWLIELADALKPMQLTPSSSPLVSETSTSVAPTTSTTKISTSITPTTSPTKTPSTLRQHQTRVERLKQALQTKPNSPNQRQSPASLAGTRKVVSRSKKAPRPKFAEWLAPNELSERMGADLFQGPMRINKKKRKFAYVQLGDDVEVVVVGQKDRNRALHGDLVVVEILGSMDGKDFVTLINGSNFKFSSTDVENAKNEIKNRLNIRTANNVSPTPTVTLSQSILIPESIDDSVSVQEEEEHHSTDDELDLEIDDELFGKIKFVARVVAVKCRRPGSVYTGLLMLSAPSSVRSNPHPSTPSPSNTVESAKKLPHNVIFKPLDVSAPLMFVACKECPSDFVENEEKYRNQIFTVEFERWPTTSLLPFARLKRQLGSMGDVAVETLAILEDNAIRTDPFLPSILESLPPAAWTIPVEEIEKRADLRSERIFTIDPATARDLDDAVSCTKLDNGNFKVGVHIADVSFFVVPATPLDNEAQLRATTTYMVHKAFPMLPGVLCENLCSLNPAVDRLAFSVMWEISGEGKVVSEWFGRTVINSCCKLSYEQAQSLIDGMEGGWGDFAGPVGTHTPSDVVVDLRGLHQLSLKLRADRFDSGALSINQPRLSYTLNDDGLPESCQIYALHDSNRLIEEFMLLANTSVARKISDFLPPPPPHSSPASTTLPQPELPTPFISPVHGPSDNSPLPPAIATPSTDSRVVQDALLRRHPPPNRKRLDEFVRDVEQLGYQLDGSSAGALHRSILDIADVKVRGVLQMLAVKPMARAVYFSTLQLPSKQAWRHYALNFDCYTHFTSPIRRYADIIVHRLLAHSLSPDSPLSIHATKSVSTIVQQCNLKKEDARNAQDASIALFLCLHLKSKSQPLLMEAVVISVGKDSFDVAIPEIAAEKRVFCGDCHLMSCSLVDGTSRLRLVHYALPFVDPMTSSSYPPYPRVAGVETGDDTISFTQSSDSSSAEAQATEGVAETMADGPVVEVTFMERITVCVLVDSTRSPMTFKAVILHPSLVPQ